MATITWTAHHHHFINGTMGAFFQGIADFFNTQLFDRSNEIIISTYEKAVQHYKKRIQDLQEHHHPKYPFISFDPALDFEPDERAGRFLWQYPQFSRQLAMNMFEPVIYNDRNVTIAPVLNRYKGRFELIIWCGSVYEYLDYRIMAYQFFGGSDRPISPKNIEAYFILPNDVVTQSVDNKFTKESYQLDWANTNVSVALIKNINTNKYVFPFALRPQIKLTGVSDGSDKYGSDDLAEWRLSIEMEWECDIPTHLISETRNMPLANNSLSFEIEFGCIYVDDIEEVAPRDIMLSITDSTTGNSERKTITFKESVIYTLTDNDIDSINDDEDIYIDFTTLVLGEEYLRIYSRFGKLIARYNWDLEDSHTIRLISSTIDNLEAGNLVTIVIYKDEI